MTYTAKQIAEMNIGDQIQINTTYGMLTITRSVKAKTMTGSNRWEINLDGVEMDEEINAADVLRVIQAAPIA